MHHAFYVDVVHNLADVRHDLSGKLQFAKAQRPAAALAAGPAEKKANHLPERIKAQASRHHGIALEMATEEPKVRLHIELGANHALAVFAAGLGNFADAVEHQHRRQRQLRIAGAKQLAAAAGQQILVFVTAAPIQHSASLSQYRWSALELNEPASHRKRVIFAHWP